MISSGFREIIESGFEQRGDELNFKLRDFESLAKIKSSKCLYQELKSPPRLIPFQFPQSAPFSIDLKTKLIFKKPFKNLGKPGYQTPIPN